MSLGRFLAVTAVVTLSIGAFGAVVGGLVGYAMPTSLPVSVRTQRTGDVSDTSGTSGTSRAGETIEYERSAEVALGRGGSQDGPSVAARGAAFGGSAGLVFGVLVGLGVGLLDQVVCAARARRQRAAAEAASRPHARVA